MKRNFAVLAFAVFAASVAVAEPDDGVMGVYTGVVGSMPAKAHVIALGNDNFKARLYYSLPDEVSPEVSIDLKGEKRDGSVVFTNGTDAVPAAQATITHQRMAGTLKEGRHEQQLNLERVVVEPETLGAAPPENAIVLFDGESMDAWERWPLKWNLTGGAMEVVGSNLVTKEAFGDCHLHLEFRTPFMPKARGQARGNSGVYIMGRYEIQVLDSFGEEPAWDYCGGIYKQAVPIVNASLPPLTWQTYDIDFTAPKFDADGKKTAHARITVRHNGTVIHNDAELTAATPGGLSGEEAPQGRILLQDHRDQVQYRNIWLVKK
jgi:hypothetical protein